MATYILKRILQAIPLVIVISMITFALIQLAPYDAVDSITTPEMPIETVNALKEQYGLNEPAYKQYFYWAENVLQGDFGYSIVNHSDISESLKTSIPNTMILVIPSFLIAFILAIVLGLLAGSNKDSKLDKFIQGMTSVFISIPTFWFAIMLVFFFATKWKIFPNLGMYTDSKNPSLGDLIYHMILPVTSLVIAFLPEMLRYVRSSTVGQLSSDYVTVQKAYGSNKITILSHHVFKNVLIPIVTIFGLSLPMLVTGAFITETIFAWPGVGQYFFNGVKQLDYPVIMAVLLLSSTLVIMGNLIADILYCIIDPRIKEMN